MESFPGYLNPSRRPNITFYMTVKFDEFYNTNCMLFYTPFFFRIKFLEITEEEEEEILANQNKEENEPEENKDENETTTFDLPFGL